MNSDALALHDAFLVRLDDAIRPLTGSSEITLTAARLLGEHLKVNRCAYADVESDENTFNLTGDYNKGVESIVGRYALLDFGAECLRLMRAGEPYIVTDSETDERTAAVRESYRATRIRSVICVPLHKGDRLVAAMAIHRIAVSVWAPDEVDLMRSVANRCWESLERSRVTRELRRSEQRLRLAQRAAKIGTFEWIVPEDRIFWTPELEALYGLPEGGFEGTLNDWRKRVEPVDAARVEAQIEQCVSSQRPECIYEFRAVLPDGRRRWLRGHAQFDYDASGTAVRMIGVNIDIDREKAAEAELRQQWQSFDSALSHTPDFAYTFDLEGRFTYVNRALLALWQRPLKDAVGKNFFDLEYPDELAARLQRQIQQVIETRAQVRDGTPFTSPLGETRFYEYIFVPIAAEDGTVKAVAGTTRDITEGRNAEELVREDRRRWRELLLQTPAAIAVLRGPEHRFEAVNSEYEKLVGQSAEVLTGKSVAEAMPELEAQLYLRLLDGVFQTGIPYTGREAPVHLRSSDGSLREMYLNFVYLPTRSVEGVIDGILAHVIDVTDMVVQRHAAEAGEKRFRTLIDSARDHAIIGLDSEGLVTDWNAGAQRLLGFAESEILGRSAEVIFTPEDRARNVPALEMRNALDSGRAVDERWHVRKDGTRFWGSGTMTPLKDEAGVTVGFVKVFQDRSREWAARETLRESEERFRQLADSMPQMVWTSRPDGTLEYFNERWFEFTGFARGEPGSEDSLLHPDDAERVRNSWAESLKTGSPGHGEYRLWDRHQSRWRWFLRRTAPAFDAAGDIAKWFGTLTDIDEQKTGQLAILQAQKLESIGLLAGGIAHDFNNLLVGIMGGASFAMETMSHQDPAYSILEGVVDASERAAHLTRQMLAYAGKGKFLVEPVDLSDLVMRTASLVKASIPKSVEVKLQLDDRLPAVDSDPGQMQQIAMNLIINAAEAVGEASGLVTVRTRSEHVQAGSRRRDVAGNLIAPGFYAVLEVQDTGSGIDSVTLGRIFDPFFTTKFTGRGLGLAAVLGVVRSHRGSIEVESQPGEGSTFRVLLPADQSTAPKPAPKVPAEVKGKGTVLVIDDESTVRFVTRAGLERAGYSVVLANDSSFNTIVSAGFIPVSSRT